MNVIQILKQEFRKLKNDSDFAYWITQRKTEKGMVAKIASNIFLNAEDDFEVILEGHKEVGFKNLDDSTKIVDLVLKSRKKIALIEFKYTNLERHYKSFQPLSETQIPEILNRIVRDINKLKNLRPINSLILERYAVLFFVYHDTNDEIEHKFHYSKDHNKMVKSGDTIEKAIEIVKEGMVSLCIKISSQIQDITVSIGNINGIPLGALFFIIPLEPYFSSFFPKTLHRIQDKS